MRDDGDAEAGAGDGGNCEVVQVEVRGVGGEVGMQGREMERCGAR